MYGDNRSFCGGCLHTDKLIVSPEINPTHDILITVRGHCVNHPWHCLYCHVR